MRAPPTHTFRPVRLLVRTRGSQPRKKGSIPLRATRHMSRVAACHGRRRSGLRSALPSATRSALVAYGLKRRPVTPEQRVRVPSRAPPVLPGPLIGRRARSERENTGSSPVRATISASLMGRPRGRGGIGRRSGFKLRRRSSVWVRVPPAAPPFLPPARHGRRSRTGRSEARAADFGDYVTTADAADSTF